MAISRWHTFRTADFVRSPPMQSLDEATARAGHPKHSRLIRDPPFTPAVSSNVQMSSAVPVGIAPRSRVGAEPLGDLCLRASRADTDTPSLAARRHLRSFRSPLPPHDPEISIDGQLSERLRAAEHALARLDLAGEMIPSLDWLIYAFVRKEPSSPLRSRALQATLVDFLAFEAEHQAAPDTHVEEICNYLDALS